MTLARWQWWLGGLLALGFLGGLAGVFVSNEKTAFVTVLAVSAGGMCLVAFYPRVSEFSIGPEGVKAKLEQVEGKLSQVEGKLDEVQKLQMEMAFQLNRDLLSKRFEAYGELWSRMQTTAIFTTKEFGPEEVSKLLEELSKWYFSATGGLLLSARARDFYFSLQGLLRAIGGFHDWQCKHRPNQPDAVFAGLLKELDLGDQRLRDEATLAQQHPEKLDPARWKLICRAISDKLESLVNKTDQRAGEMIYAAIQQVASVLRSNLADELGSRLPVDRPAVR